MSVTDPLRFIVGLIILGGTLQFLGIMEGPCNLGGISAM